MTRTPLLFLLALPCLVGCLPTPALHRGEEGATLVALAPTQAVPAQTDTCAIYRAAIDASFGTDSAPVVLYDSTSMGIPSFAFHAWTGLDYRKPDSTFTLTDSLVAALRTALGARGPLPACLNQDRALTRLPYDALRSHFKDRRQGWEVFKQAFPGARGFGMFSQVLLLPGDEPAALLYVAHAQHWLSGSGEVLLLRRRAGRWAVVARKPVWAS